MTNDWRDEGACRGSDPNDWFPVDYSIEHDTRMTRICIEECPVQEECLEYALTNVEKIGIWGGFTQAELRGIRTRRYSRCRTCGTRWPKSRLTNETTCRYCRMAEDDDRNGRPRSRVAPLTRPFEENSAEAAEQGGDGREP